jgi:5-methylcytosine-specific restriction endonuclease McrA
MRWKAHGDISTIDSVFRGTLGCSIEECQRRHHSLGLCKSHYLTIIANPKRRAIKEHAKINDFTSDQWMLILKKYKYMCAYCNKADNLAQDHVIPLSKGGNHTANNIVPSCKSCNSKKNNSINKFIPRNRS